MQSTKIKVNKSEEFRSRAAKSIVEELCGDLKGRYYVDINTWEIYFREHNALNSWMDNKSVVHLTDLIPGDIDVNDSVEDWCEALEGKTISLEDILTDYSKDESSDEEDDRSLIYWIDDAITWASTSEKFSSLIEECKEDARKSVIRFVLEEMLEEIEC